MTSKNNFFQLGSFFQGVDLIGENWHSGIVKLDNNNKWEYKSSYLDDCIREDELADLVYLRSGDKRKAFGVITNRRANYFTLGSGECVMDSAIARPYHTKDSIQNIFNIFPFRKYTDSLTSYGAVFPRNGSNKIQLRNMKSNLYSINYYSPYNLSSPIGTEIAIGPALNLDFPTMDSLDIILFTTQRSNINFKSGFSDTVFAEETMQREVKDEKEIAVYPNPNDGNFKVYIEDTEKIKHIELTDQMGRIFRKEKVQGKTTLFEGLNLSAGIYTVHVVFEEYTITRKVVVK